MTYGREQLKYISEKISEPPFCGPSIWPSKDPEGKTKCGRTVPYLVSALVGEVQLRLLGAEVNPRPLGHHLQVNGFVRLHPHHQLVPLTAVCKDLARHVGELQAHLGLALVQGFATAEDERDPWWRGSTRGSRGSGLVGENQGKSLTVPSFIADVEHGGGKGRRAGALRHRGVVQVAQPGLALALGVAHVLAQHHVGDGHGSDALQHLHLRGAGEGQ